MKLASIAALGLVIAGLSVTGTAQGVSAELKVGVFLPISGPTADIGAQMRNGVEVALEHINARPKKAGVDQPTLKVIFYDDEGKADVGLNAVTRALTVDKINVGIGFFSSDVFMRTMEEFDKASVPVVACCAGSNNIGRAIAEKKLSYAFQLSPNVTDIANAIAAATANIVKAKKIALLNHNTDAGRDLSKATKEWLASNAAGVEIVADEFVPTGVADLTVQLAKFRRLGAEAIVGEIFGASAPVLYRQSLEMKIPAVIAHMGATTSAQTFIDQNRQAMEGSIVNVRWWPARYSELSDVMLQAYQRKVGSSPTNFSVQAFDATIVAAEAAAAAGNLEGAKIRDALANTTFVTAWGARKFTSLEQGHRMPIETVVVQIQDGKKVPIYPDAVAKAAGSSWRPLPPFAWEKN